MYQLNLIFQSKNKNTTFQPSSLFLASSGPFLTTILSIPLHQLHPLPTPTSHKLPLAHSISPKENPPVNPPHAANQLPARHLGRGVVTPFGRQGCCGTLIDGILQVVLFLYLCSWGLWDRMVMGWWFNWIGTSKSQSVVRTN